MSEKGESDLDVFSSLGTASSGPPNRTLIGQSAAPPPAAPPPPPAVGGRPITAPPPTASPAAEEIIDDADLLEEDDALTELEPEFEDDDGTASDAMQLLAGPAGAQPSIPTNPRPHALASSVPPRGVAPPPTNLSAPSRPSLPPPSAPGASLPPPPPVPSAAVASQPNASDWDDEDDKTTVYTRGDLEDASNALLNPFSPPTGGVPGAPPPPMSRPSAPVPTAPHRTMTSLRRATAPSSAPAPASVPPGAAVNRTPLMMAAVAAIVVAVGLFLLLRPSGGGLVVTVAGPGGQPLDAVQVFVDGKPKCKSSPCKLENLKAGTHMVKATAAGHQETADTAVVVSSGQEAVHNIKLIRASGTGLRISANGTGLKLLIDGKDVGPLPQELKSLTAGDHVVLVSGEHFKDWTQNVTIAPNEMLTLGPLKLKVVEGLAQIRAGGGAKGARVVLESDGDRRSLPKLPISLRINTSKPHTLIATKRGFETFRQVLDFDDGQAEKTFEIVMTKESDDDATPAPARPTRRSSARSRPAPRKAPSSASDDSSSSKGGKATLNINSIPSSKVLLDGRPLGTTPRVGVSVSAGSHSVVFSKDGKRASKRVTVKAGQTKAVVHRFK